MQNFDLENISKVKKWSLLCYIPFFNIISCTLAAVRAPESEAVRFHLRQGLVIFAMWIIALLISFLSYILGLIVWAIVFLLYIACLGMILTGNKVYIPGIAQLAMKIPEFYLFRLLSGKEPKEEWMTKTESPPPADNSNIQK